MDRFFGNLYRFARHSIIRFWERYLATQDCDSGPECDFWLVCHSKDQRVALLTIESIYRFSLNTVGTIFLIGDLPDRPDWLPGNIQYIHELELPASSMVFEELEGVQYRGWVLQQVLKFSGAFYSNQYVVIDCDTVLIRPHLFFSKSGTCLRLAYEHSPHYRHFEKSVNVSGANFLSFTCHMMAYKSEYLISLFSQIERATGQNWVRYICCYAKANGMVINEQDLYARFIINRRELILLRPWLNKTVPYLELDGIENLRKKFPDRNSISFHNNDEREMVVKVRHV